MDTRIGYPNEHLAGDSDSETTSPLYATAVGLVMNSLESKARANNLSKHDGIHTVAQKDGEAPVSGEELQEEDQPTGGKQRSGIFDKWAEKFKEFLDNAE
jgi:cell division protein FtsA